VTEAAFASTSLSLPPGLSMAGYARRIGVAQGTHDSLSVSAAVFRASGRLFAILSLDLVAITRDLASDLVAVLDANGIAAMDFIAAATHTHSGPGEGYDALVTGKALYTEAVRSEIMRGTVFCLRAAINHLQPCRIYAAEDEIPGIARNRFFGAAQVPPRARVVLVRNVAGHVIGCLTNYAAHPTVLDETNLRWSPDYVGAFRHALASHVSNAPILFLNGASADISTRGVRIASTKAEAERLGRELADQFRPLVAGASEVASEPVMAASKKVKVKAKHFPNDDEIDQLIRRLEERLQGARRLDDGSARSAANDLLAAQHLRRVADAFRGRTDELELRAVKIGDVVALALPGELFSEFEDDLTAAAAKSILLIATTANGYFGYFVPPRVAEKDQYEVLMSWVAPASTEAMIEAASELLKQLTSR
jgi:neutral ceramidase